MQDDPLPPSSPFGRIALPHLLGVLGTLELVLAWSASYGASHVGSFSSINRFWPLAIILSLSGLHAGMLFGLRRRLRAGHDVRSWDSLASVVHALSVVPLAWWYFTDDAGLIRLLYSGFAVLSLTRLVLQENVRNGWIVHEDLQPPRPREGPAPEPPRRLLALGAAAAVLIVSLLLLDVVIEGKRAFLNASWFWERPDGTFELSMVHLFVVPAPFVLAIITAALRSRMAGTASRVAVPVLLMAMAVYLMMLPGIIDGIQGASANPVLTSALGGALLFMGVLLLVIPRRKLRLRWRKAQT